MKCPKCGNEFDASAVPTSCPRCGTSLPYMEVRLMVKKGTSQEEFAGRVQIEENYLRFAKKKLSKNPFAVSFFGLVITSLYDAFDKNALLIFERHDFTEIRKEVNPSGILLYYELFTQGGSFKLFPMVKNTQTFEADMDSFISLSEKNADSGDISDEALANLKQLYDQGVLTEEEYDAKVKQLLPVASETEQVSEESSINYEDLKVLEELKQDGVINHEEYSQKVSQLLNLSIPQNTASKQINKRKRNGFIGIAILAVVAAIIAAFVFTSGSTMFGIENNENDTNEALSSKKRPEIITPTLVIGTYETKDGDFYTLLKDKTLETPNASFTGRWKIVNLKEYTVEIKYEISDLLYESIVEKLEENGEDPSQYSMEYWTDYARENDDAFKELLPEGIYTYNFYDETLRDPEGSVILTKISY